MATHKDTRDTAQAKERQLNHYRLPLQQSKDHQKSRETNRWNESVALEQADSKQHLLQTKQESRLSKQKLEDGSKCLSPQESASFYQRNALSRTSNQDNSQSRRRLSHSPVSVNTTYELGQRNTEKLWREFNNHLRNSASSGSQGRSSQPNLNTKQYATSQTYLLQNSQSLRQRKNSPTPLMKFKNERSSLGQLDRIEKQSSNKKALHTMGAALRTKIQPQPIERNHGLGMNGNPSFGEEDMIHCGGTDFASLEQPGQSAYHTQQDLKMEFYRTSGIIPPTTNESKNKVMLGSRLREMFQVSHDGSSDNQTPSQFNYARTSIQGDNTRPLKYYDLAHRQSMSPQSNANASIRSSEKKNQTDNQPNARQIYQKYLDLGTNERQSNGSAMQSLNGTSSEFKLKVQQKIMEISQDLKNPSPISTTNGSQPVLEQYLRNQNGSISKKTAKNSLDSMQNNQDNSLNPIDVTTARFINHYPQGSIRLSHQQNQSLGQPTIADIFCKPNYEVQDQINESDEAGIHHGHEGRTSSLIQSSLSGGFNSSQKKGASRRTYSSGKKSEKRQSHGTRGSSIRFEDELKSKQETMLQSIPQEEGLKSSHSSKLFQVNRGESKVRAPVTDKPYFHKDWSYLKTQSDMKCHSYNHGNFRATTQPLLEEIDNLIASHYYRADVSSRQPLREFKSPNTLKQSQGRYNFQYDMIVDENDHLLLNDNGRAKDFKQISSKFWNLKERITFIQEEVQSMLDQIQAYQVLKPNSLTPQEAVTKIFIAEKLLRMLQQKQTGDLNEYLTLRFYNTFLLLSLFKLDGDQKRILKYLETNNKSNLNLVDSMLYICRRPRIKKELSFYILHILNIKAGALFKHDEVERATPVYSQICELYERWRNNRYQDQQAALSEKHSKNIFGTEGYIQARAMFAECLQIQNKLFEAVTQFEHIKREMESLVIFEDSVLYIHVCNQLGNCYFKLAEYDRALENLQQSLLSIHQIRGQANEQTKSPVDDLVIAKICRNIAIIADMKGYHNDCIKMNEQCLMFKLKVLPLHHEEILLSQIQCAQAYEQVGDLQLASQYFEKAYLTCKVLNGDSDHQTVSILQKFSSLRQTMVDSMNLSSQPLTALSTLDKAIV